MSDYISRETASVVIEGEQKKLCPVGLWGRKFAADADKYDMLQEMLDKLEAIPAADVEPVRHGQWLRTDDDWNSLVTIQCSACGGEWCFEVDEDVQLLGYNYGPGCGCKMDLEDETNDD